MVLYNGTKLFIIHYFPGILNSQNSILPDWRVSYLVFSRTLLEMAQRLCVSGVLAAKNGISISPPSIWTTMRSLAWATLNFMSSKAIRFEVYKFRALGVLPCPNPDDAPYDRFWVGDLMSDLWAVDRALDGDSNNPELVAIRDRLRRAIERMDYSIKSAKPEE